MLHRALVDASSGILQYPVAAGCRGVGGPPSSGLQRHRCPWMETSLIRCLVVSSYGSLAWLTWCCALRRERVLITQHVAWTTQPHCSGRRVITAAMTTACGSACEEGDHGPHR